MCFNLLNQFCVRRDLGDHNYNPKKSKTYKYKIQKKRHTKYWLVILLIVVILSLLAFQIILWYEVGKFKANATRPLTGYMLAKQQKLPLTNTCRIQLM